MPHTSFGWEYVCTAFTVPWSSSNATKWTSLLSLTTLNNIVTTKGLPWVESAHQEQMLVLLALHCTQSPRRVVQAVSSLFLHGSTGKLGLGNTKFVEKIGLLSRISFLSCFF